MRRGPRDARIWVMMQGDHMPELADGTIREDSTPSCNFPVSYRTTGHAASAAPGWHFGLTMQEMHTGAGRGDRPQGRRAAL